MKVVPLEITEENFIEQLKKRNEKALEYVIDHYAWILKTVIKKHLVYLPNYYEECVNDCLWAIWENIGYYDPEKSSFKNWVGGIAKYKSINYARKYLRDLENEPIENTVIPADDEAIREILNREVSSETEKMLCRLAPEDREIFIKLYLEEQSMDEISSTMGLTKPVLYNRISRGKKKIREAVGIKGGPHNERI